MRFFEWRKDGGPESTVEGLFLVEIKNWFSIVLLKFSNGTRDAYHDHAFNALSWLLKGQLYEMQFGHDLSEFGLTRYKPSFKPIYTPRERMHKVSSHGTSWALSFRGPWSDKWSEYRPSGEGFVQLTYGRKEVK